MKSIEKRKQQAKANHKARLKAINELGLHDEYIIYYQTHTNVAAYRRSQRFCALRKIDWRKIVEEKAAKAKIKIEPNFDLNINYATAKAVIKMRGRYSYFDFDYETVKKIAETDFEEIDWGDAAVLVQCLYPSYLVCNGIFDPFLLFKMTDDGMRIDPPVASWRGLSWRQNEDYANSNFLISDILMLFDKNAIIAHASWHALLDKAILHDEERKAAK